MTASLPPPPCTSPPASTRAICTALTRAPSGNMNQPLPNTLKTHVNLNARTVVDSRASGNRSGSNQRVHWAPARTHTDRQQLAARLRLTCY
eukprot:15474385-Alexandrium_andersonii.AAC.1